jgi:hypothetical protein
MIDEKLKTQYANRAMKRIVDDGNCIQEMIGKLDYQLSVGTPETASEIVNILGNLNVQMDGDLAALMGILEQ